MQLIPVIDLLNGMVVHAKKGDRKHYRPIQSLISDSSKPLDIVAALLEYHPFKQLYIADLNAIQKSGDNNLHTIELISQQYPDLKLWVDAGISSTSELALWNERNFNLILGSESFSSLDNFLETSKRVRAGFTLSLDFMADGYKGPVELINTPEHWPENVILMSLANVGANQGLNIKLLEKFMPYAQQFKLHAAGGVRNADDIAWLKQNGYNGVLIASALHSRQLTSQDIKTLLQ